MKTAIALLLVASAALLFWLDSSGRAAGVEVEFFYLPHRPALAVVSKAEAIIAEFGNIKISRHSFEEPEGRKLAAAYGLTDHMPVAIFINGQNRFTLNGGTIQLRNFPKGDPFVPSFAGEWDYPDLREILRQQGAR